MSTTPNPFGELLTYTSRGWPVFPVYGPKDGRCSCGDPKCESPAKHPRIKGWQQNASTDSAQIERWATQFPGCNWGMPTGPASGVDVMDEDPRHGGDNTLKDFQAVNGTLPETVRVLTQSDGTHHLFNSDPTHPIRNGTNVLGPGVDVRGDGGFVVIPPSVGLTGRAYRFDLSAHPDDVPVANWTEPLLKKVNGAAPGGTLAPRLDVPAVLAGVPEGHREESIFRLACKLRRADVPEDAALDVVLKAASNAVPPFPADKAEERLRRAYRTYQAGPEPVALKVSKQLSDDEQAALTMLATKREYHEPPTELPHPANLYGDTFAPRRPDFDVKSFLRRSGIVLAWSAPGGLKTHSTMVLCHEMLCDTGTGSLFGHPDLWINRHWKRVLWIATEECGDELRFQAEQVLKGLGKDKLDGELHYLFASRADQRVTLDDLQELIERDGSWDAIILDSLTGLRPKVVNGVSVKWDLDNDAGNEMCLKLRGLAAKHNVCFVILHHSGRDTSRYRGGVDWWASADTMFGLLPDGGMVKVEVEKVRGGKKPASFILEPVWAADESFTLTYSGAAAPAKLTDSAKTMLVHLKAKGTASQTEMIAAAGCARSTGTSSMRMLIEAGYAVDTGTKRDKSPVYLYREPGKTEVSDSQTGHLEAKD